MKIGIAFSGGGIRGASHLGIAQALYENGINPTIFTGTSSGSIVATLLAMGYEPKEAFKLFERVDNIVDIAYLHILRGLLTKSTVKGMAKGNKLHSILDSIFGGVLLDDISKSVQLAIVTTKLDTGTQTIFTNGFYPVDFKHIYDTNINWSAQYSEKISDIVRASCSIPGVYIPQKIGNYDYIDGGITNNLPSDIALSLGADKVISVDLGYSGKLRETKDVFEIVSQSMYILMEGVVDGHVVEDSLYLNPEIYDVGSLEIEKVKECYNRGYEYAQANMDKILKGLSE
jgi:NTE family protein